MINLILKKLSVLFALTLLIALTPVLSGSNDARAACTFTADANDPTIGTCTGTPTIGNGVCATGTVSEAECTASDNGVSGTNRATSNQVNENAFVDTLCNVFNIATGNGGKAFAAFAIISLGIGFFTGKVSWGLMIGVAAGIAAMFGAPTIVAAISGDSAFGCEPPENN